MKKKKEKDTDIIFGIEMGHHISLNNIETGRLPIPYYNDSFAEFTIYEPNISETIKMAYEGLINVWKQQGKNPIKELEKMIKRK